MCPSKASVASRKSSNGGDDECAVGSFVMVPIRLFEQIITAARGGQLLPQLTLVFMAQIGLHTTLLRSSSTLSLALVVVSACLNLCGYILLIALYRHSVKTIFNRSLSPTLLQCLPSFGAHLSLLKPLEVMFRYATARFRVLPDILVLGEVRCGTTTLCQHLTSLEGCEPPFCLWKHPELDRKETFYFVGHYLGKVDPFSYRMCFSLAIRKWFYDKILGRPFFTFDGCAQYLTNPAVPYLIAKAYRDAGQPPPVLVACVRNPVDQAISWWRYENNAMLWGASMGLTRWNTELRSPHYPPMSITAALDFSSSKTVDEAYRMTEDLFCKDENDYVLPPWAMTWPGGQLSGIGRNGRFAANIQRYERVFANVFGQDDSEKKIPAASNLKFVNVIPLEFLTNVQQLNLTLTSLMSQVDARRKCAPLLKSSELCANNQIRRNTSGLLTSSFLEPSPADIERLQVHFSKDSTELEAMTGMNLGWTLGAPSS